MSGLRLKSGFRTAMILVSLVILACLLADPTAAVEWKITGYTPSTISFGTPATATVTIQGTFANTIGARRVKLGKDTQPLYDVSTGVSFWSNAQITLRVPSTVQGGLYWVGIFGSDGGLKVKGPRALIVNKPAKLAQDPGEAAPTLQFRPAHTAVGAPELEIVNVLGFPANACAGVKYPVSASVRNNGKRAAEFAVCAVGSTTQGCLSGPPEVFTLNGGATSWFAVSLRPDGRYIVDGAWKGRFFLGEAKKPAPAAEETRLKLQGSAGAPGVSGNCSTPVSLSIPGGGQGLPGWWLFCDKNMGNHLREFSVPSNPEACPQRLKF